MSLMDILANPFLKILTSNEIRHIIKDVVLQGQLSVNDNIAEFDRFLRQCDNIEKINIPGIRGLNRINVNIKDVLSKKMYQLSKNIVNNKNFFNKDLEKNIYFNDKHHLISLNILNYAINPKANSKDFSNNLKRILKSRTHKLSYDGKYLINNGMKQGKMMGEVLKHIENEWIKNNFKIDKERVKEIIRLHSN